MRCQVCLYESENVESFRKHFSRATCRVARTVRFSCRHCDFIGNSVKQVLKHGCPDNVMATVNGNGLLTTAAVTQWHVMKKQLKEARQYIPNLQLSDINLSNEKQLSTLPTLLLLDLYKVKKWLNSDHIGLLPLKLESVAEFNKSKNSSILAHKFFDFYVHGQIDARHFFKLLFANAEASYWPFCGFDQFDSILRSTPHWCGKSSKTGQFYLRVTSQRLINAVYEKTYTDWKWVQMTPEDFSRFIHDEWTSIHFRNIIRILKQLLPNLVNETWTNLETETKRVAEKLELLFPPLLPFMKFWGKEESVRRRVEELDINTCLETFECVKLSSTFGETVKSVLAKKDHRKWEPIINLLSSN